MRKPALAVAALILAGLALSACGSCDEDLGWPFKHSAPGPSAPAGAPDATNSALPPPTYGR